MLSERNLSFLAREVVPKAFAGITQNKGVVFYPENLETLLNAARQEAVSVIRGLMEIAEIAMPDSYFASDSRTEAARAFLKYAGR